MAPWHYWRTNIGRQCSRIPAKQPPCYRRNGAASTALHRRSSGRSFQGAHLLSVERPRTGGTVIVCATGSASEGQLCSICISLRSNHWGTFFPRPSKCRTRFPWGSAGIAIMVAQNTGESEWHTRYHRLTVPPRRLRSRCL